MRRINNKMPRRVNSNVLAIKRVERRVAGTSQAYLVEAEDDHWYIAKFFNNPQGNRTLINEMIAGSLLELLEVKTPPLRVLHFTHQTHKSVEPIFERGGKFVTAVEENALHLGSRCPVNPETTAIFDFVPLPVLATISNLNDVGTTYVFDRWVGQADSRQTIMIRDKQQRPFNNMLYMVDHGMSFGGNEWVIRELPLAGLYMHRSIYEQIDMRRICASAISRIAGLSEIDLHQYATNIPECWFASEDRKELTKLIKRLLGRMSRLHDIVEWHLRVLHKELSSVRRVDPVAVG